MKINKRISLLICGFAIITLSGCSEARYAAHVAKQIPLPQDTPSKSKGYFKVGSSYKIKGKRYYPSEAYNLTETGTASWYGPGFHGKLTANGEIFDKNEMTAAHRTLQMPSIIKVTNLANGRSAILRVNDRGPFAHDRILDVSERAASVLGFKEKGVANIRLEVVADASKEVAAMAKERISTRGYEIAYAQGKRPTSANIQNVQTPAPALNIEPVTKVALGNSGDSAPVPTLHTATVRAEDQGLARVPPVQATPLNDVVQNAVSAQPSTGYVQSNGKVFVQAGSFSQEANALKYSDSLNQIGPSRVYVTRVDNQPYFRVRLGPYNNSNQAQQVLAALTKSGNQNAVIVTE